MKLKVLLVCMFALLLSSCKVSKGPGYFDFEPEYLNTEGDGSLTLRVWGDGRNLFDAIPQAQKNAVDAVLFKGITKGGLTGYLSRPLVPEVNAREKYQTYFNNFFKDGGDYTKYVSKHDRRIGTTERRENGTQVKWGVTLRVYVPELKARLIQDGILKP